MERVKAWSGYTDMDSDSGPTGVIDAVEAYERRVFEKILELCKEPGKTVTSQRLAEELSIHAHNGSYTTSLAWLRQMGVITERGPIAPTEGVFR